MYGNYKKRGKKPKKKYMSATSKAYWSGFKAGKRFAFAKRRWH